MESQTILIAFLFCLLALACCLCLVLGLWYRRAFASMRRQINEAAGRIEQLEDNCRTDTDSESHCLTRKELAGRFEQLGSRQTDVSAKYRHVARLVRSGLGTKELSEVLDVSPMEAEQMLVLARMAEKAA